MPSASLIADFHRSLELRRRLITPMSYMAAAGVSLDPWQQQVLCSTAQRVLLCCSRQSGKSFVTAAITGYTAMAKRNRDVLIVSKSQRQAINLLRTARQMYEDAGMPVSPVSIKYQSIELANGSRVVALPGASESIRGFGNLALLILDEAAFVPDELYMSVRPMLAVGNGRLIALSSPHGTRGWFYETWERTQRDRAEGRTPDWDVYEITADQCPRISAEFLAQEKRDMGEWWYQQEYFCKFLDAETQLFGRDEVDAMMQEDVEQWVLPAW